MSRYSKMQAPPFWMWMFRIVGIACLITLLTPTLYLLKYALHDRPSEEAYASSNRSAVSALAAPASSAGTQLYITSAESGANSTIRLMAISRLGDLATSTKALILSPVECLYAKLALEQVARTAPSAQVRQSAKDELFNVAKHGAVISR